jgi:hypothetical protein
MELWARQRPDGVERLVRRQRQRPVRREGVDRDPQGSPARGVQLGEELGALFQLGLAAPPRRAATRI